MTARPLRNGVDHKRIGRVTRKYGIHGLRRRCQYRTSWVRTYRRGDTACGDSGLDAAAMIAPSQRWAIQPSGRHARTLTSVFLEEIGILTWSSTPSNEPIADFIHGPDRSAARSIRQGSTRNEPSHGGHPLVDETHCSTTHPTPLSTNLDASRRGQAPTRRSRSDAASVPRAGTVGMIEASATRALDAANPQIGPDRHNAIMDDADRARTNLAVIGTRDPWLTAVSEVGKVAPQRRGPSCRACRRSLTGRIPRRNSSTMTRSVSVSPRARWG